MRFPVKQVLDFARAGTGRSRVVVFATRDAVGRTCKTSIPGVRSERSRLGKSQTASQSLAYVAHIGFNSLQFIC